MIRALKGAFSLAIGALALAACGGSGTQTAGIDRGGIATPVSVVGPITGFGSIIVNDVHYNVDKASVVVDGDAATASDLELGQVVTVVGERDASGATGTATQVLFQTNVRGPISALDTATSEITVLGQKVIVGSSTVFDLAGLPAAFGSLRVGDLVAVSGFVSAHGAIEATRIQSVMASSGLLAFGVVSNLDSALLRFNLGALVVDYSQATLIQGFASGGPSNGDRVLVRATSTAPSGALLAREVRRAEDEEAQAGQEAEVEGLITRFGSATDFDVGGRPVTTTATTTYQGGGSSALALNVKVEVEGAVNASGVIVATLVAIEGGAGTDD
jgi:uncharacterized protein DUF5666